MYRGRIEIFSPDGPVENFFIEKDMIAVGRSSGNDLILDRHGISRYHISISAKDQQAMVQDLESVNGTYVDGLRLKPNEPYNLRGGEEIQIGDLRLIFHPPNDFDETIQTSIQTLEVEAFRVEMEGPDIAVAPGAHCPATLKIFNTTNKAQDFFIEVEGIPKEWVRIDRPEFNLAPDATVQVGLNFKPLRRPQTKPGEYTITARVAIKSAPERGIAIRAKLLILPYSGYGVVMGTPLIENNTYFKLYIHNQGNAPLPLRFYGASRAYPVQFEIQPNKLILAPGERQNILGRVRPTKRPFVGNSKIFYYDIISHSQDAAGFVAPVSGQYKVNPLLPTWSLLLALPILGLIVLVFIFLLASINADSNSTSESAPLIHSFVLNNKETIMLNRPVFISWDAEYAETIQLEIRHETQPSQMVILPSRRGSNYPVYLSNAGRFTAILTAKNDKGEATDEHIILVSPAITLNLTVLPQQEKILYRNLAGQQLQIEWQIDWGDSVAPSVYIEIPALNLTQTQLEWSDLPKLVEVPTLTTLDSITVNLLSVGPDNVQTSRTTSIFVDYPECTTTTNLAQIDVYREPALQSSLLGALPSGFAIRIEARDPATSWLRIPIPKEYIQVGFFGWVQIENLDCSTFDPTQLVLPIANG